MAKKIITLLGLSCILACNLPITNKANAEELNNRETFDDNKPTKPINIIPQPVSITKREGSFTINDKTTIVVPQNENWSKTAAFLQQKFKTAAGFELPIQNEAQKHNIVFQIDPSIQNDEAYSLDITKNQILIKAKTEKGAFYGIQTLLQLLPDEIESKQLVSSKHWNVPCCNIWDEPRYVWRGMHLDVGRHFFDVNFVKRYLDLMAMHKFNHFHWHLTEDQGWRIEIKRYPKLTEIGGYRNGTLIGKPQPNGQEKYDGQRYGGFYTQEQIKEVVKYAAERHIEVVPEIEMPGHSLAALSAYPELACDKGPFQASMTWGAFRPVFCPTDETFEFLQNVLTEVMELFPSQYIHIGGDEVMKDSWKDSEFCQNLMQKENLSNEEELQSYFIRRIEKFLTSKNRKLIGWDEILEGGLSDNATVMSWRGDRGGIEAAKQRHDVIMAPNSYCYFDHYQVADRDKEPIAFNSMVTLKKVYSFNPTPEELLPHEAKHILGAQGNVWTEYMKTTDKVEYMVFPRALALSEVLWTPEEKKVWQEFKPRLKQHLKRFDIMGVNYAKHIFNN